MDKPGGDTPKPELRDYLAEERTFLAWIRTGLTLMGFGFVVARFGLFLQVLQASRGESVAPRHGLSPWIGTAFVAAGVIVNLLSVRRHTRQVRELNLGSIIERRPSRMAIVLALFLAAVGAAMGLYLLFT